MKSKKYFLITISALLVLISISSYSKAFADIGKYGTFTISDISGKSYLEVSGDNLQGTKLENNTTIVQKAISLNEQKEINRWQKWLICKQTNGYFTIMNLNSGKYLSVTGNSKTAGATLMQYSRVESDSQYWLIIPINGGVYKIINKKSLLAISCKDDSITQKNFINAPDQQWKITSIKADSYRDDAVVGFFQRTYGSDAFDEGSSIPLYSKINKGKVFWITGDTYYNQVDKKGEFGCNLFFPYHNSALLQPADHSWDPNKTTNVISKDGAQIFNPANPKNLFWPGAGVEIGNYIYVHNIEVIKGTLTTVDQYLGVVSEINKKIIPTVKMVKVLGMSGQTKIVYTIGMVKSADGYIYAYGIGGPMASNVYVARFKPASPTKWTFWNGKYWAASSNDDPAAAVAKAPVNNNAVGFVNGKYVLITMDFGFTCDAINRNMYSSTSTSPVGPFINKKLIYTLPDYKQGHSPVYYNPTVHAEFNNGHQELLIAYCINFYNKNDGKDGTCLTPCSNPDGSMDPNDYRIKGVRVPFALMGL